MAKNYNLTSQQIKDTYEQLAQISGSVLVNGTGSAITSLEVSASYATSALTASYALNAEGVSVDTGSLLRDASATLNVITFTKGDNSTFNVTVDTGSAAGGLDPAVFNAYTSSNDARVDSLTAATSSYLTSADISGKLDTSVFNVYTSSNDSAVSTLDSRVDSLTAATSSYLTSADVSNKLDTSVFNAYTSSNDSAVSGKLDTSTFTSYSSSISTRLTTGEDNISTLTAQTASYAKTNVNNVFTGTQTFTNIAVNGTGSFAYIESVTGSAKIIGDAYIVLNNNTPAERYAGVKVFDSGSTENSASLEFDGQTNDWFYEYTDDGGATTEFGVVMFGPGYNTKGSHVYPSNNTILKGTGDHHIVDSIITDDGSTVTVGGDIEANVIQANTYFVGDVIGTATTASYVSGSSVDGSVSNAVSASYAVTASYALNAAGGGAGLEAGSGVDAMQSSAEVSGVANASGDYSIAIGNGALSSAENAIAIGNSAEATQNDTIVIGANSTTVSEGSIILGNNTVQAANSDNVIYIGHSISPTTNDSSCVVIGHSSSTAGFFGVGVGGGNTIGASAVNIGYATETYGDSGIAVGRQSVAQTGDFNIAIGREATAGFGGETNTKSIAIGYLAAAYGSNCISIGDTAFIDFNKDNAIAIGRSAVGGANDTIAIGRTAEANGTDSISIGNGSTANVGGDNVAIGAAAAAGYGGEGGNSNNVAVGSSAGARGANDVVLGANSSIDFAYDRTVLVGSTLTGNVNDGIGIGYNLTLSSNNEINIGDKFKYDGTSAITLNSSTIKVAASGSQTGSLIDNIHPAIASSSAQINHIVTLTQDQYTAMSGSGNANDDTLYIVSDEGDYIHNGNLGISGQLYSPFSTSTVASSTSSIDFNEGNFSNLALTSATYIDNPSNLKSGTTYTLVITSGSLISNFNTAWKFSGGVLPTFSNGTDVLTCVSDGTNLYTAALTDFQ